MRQKRGSARTAERGGVSRLAERRRRLVRPASAVHPAGIVGGFGGLSSAGVGASQQGIRRARRVSIYGGLGGLGGLIISASAGHHQRGSERLIISASAGHHQRIIGGLRGALISASSGGFGGL